MLDTNTATQGWVFETAQNDSIYSVINNKLALIENNMNATPTGITFDSSNGLAYFTYAAPPAGAAGLAAISGNQIVSTPISSNLQSAPYGVAYDLYYNYLYVSYNSMGNNNNQSELGVGVFEPDSGTPVGYIPMTTGYPTLYAYDSWNGDMFAAVPNNNGTTTTTIYEIRNLAISTNFTISGTPTSMIFDSTNGYLYTALQGGNIIVSDSSSGNSVVGTIPTSGTVTAMVYDSSTQKVYAFESSDILLSISGTSIISKAPTYYSVTSALYDAQDGSSILAFY